MESEKKIEIQVKVPVCITIELTKDDAESMFLDELSEVVDGILEEIGEACEEMTRFRGVTCGGREIMTSYRAAPYWDHLPADDCELTSTFKGLFPERD